MGGRDGGALVGTNCFHGWFPGRVEVEERGWSSPAQPPRWRPAEPSSLSGAFLHPPQTHPSGVEGGTLRTALLCCSRPSLMVAAFAREAAR